MGPLAILSSQTAGILSAKRTHIMVGVKSSITKKLENGATNPARVGIRAL